MFPFVKPVYAQCPVCVITVGGGLLIAKKLGIDDLLVSIWLSGLNSAVAFWMANSIKKKVLNNGYFWSLIFYGLTMVYLAYTKQLNHQTNKFLGVDKVFFGMTVGLLTFFLAVFFDKLLRKIKKGKVLFAYQKVIIPLVLLSLVTFIFKLWI
jgi:hypothetical protein